MTDRRTQPDTTTDRPISRRTHDELFLATCYAKSQVEEEEFGRKQTQDYHNKLLNMSMQLGTDTQDDLQNEPQNQYEKEIENASRNSVYVRDFINHTKRHGLLSTERNRHRDNIIRARYTRTVLMGQQDQNQLQFIQPQTPNGSQTARRFLPSSITGTQLQPQLQSQQQPQQQIPTGQAPPTQESQTGISGQAPTGTIPQTGSQTQTQTQTSTQSQPNQNQNATVTTQYQRDGTPSTHSQASIVTPRRLDFSAAMKSILKTPTSKLRSEMKK